MDKNGKDTDSEFDNDKPEVEGGNRGLSSAVSLLRHAERIGLFFLMTGAIAGFAAVGISISGIFLEHARDAMMYLFFYPASLLLAGVGSVFVIRWVFAAISGGKDLGRLKAIFHVHSNSTKLEAVLIYAYFVSSLAVSLFIGFFVSAWITLLVSGKFWQLIGAR